jgi:lysophospholipid acyltransferase (LPLAT)-like uncharacterized protein
VHERAPRRRLADHPAARWFIGSVLLGGYLRFIRATSKIDYQPEGQWDVIHAIAPVIGVSWHGQANLAYAYTPHPEDWAVLISNHPDGRMAAALARSFGFNTIDGSGASERQKHGTGGVAAYRAMMRGLKDGQSLSLTADVPPVEGRVISPGIIAIARRSGRPVFALATSSSRRKVLERVWDRMQINYPFSRVRYVTEGPLWMTDKAKSDAEYEAELRAMLDRVLAKALAVADER